MLRLYENKLKQISTQRVKLELARATMATEASPQQRISKTMALAYLPVATVRMASELRVHRQREKHSAHGNFNL